MDGDEERYVIAVDELGQKGLWASVKEVFESRGPLRDVNVSNKLARVTTLSTLPVQYVIANDKRLQTLKPLATSAKVWWRQPYAHMLLLCTADINEYRAHLKQVARKAVQELEKDGPAQGGPAEWLIVYIRPHNVDPQDRVSSKVFQKIVEDFGGPTGASSIAAVSGRRGPPPSVRVVRLDWPYRGLLGPNGQALPFVPAPPTTSAAAAFFSDLARPFSSVHGGTATAPASTATQASSSSGAVSSHGQPAGLQITLPSNQPGVGTSAGGAVAGGMAAEGVAGMDEVESALKECVRCSFESRQGAYVDAVQRLLAERFDPKWLFSQLFLVKDCYTQQLETAGMWADALQEVVELEAAFTETIDRGAVAQLDFGVAQEGADTALIISHSRRSIRNSVFKHGVINVLSFRQFLFAAQARVLLRLGQPVDMAYRGLDFIRAISQLLEQQSQQHQHASAHDLHNAHPIPAMFKEAWTFSACVALAAALTNSLSSPAADLSPSQPRHRSVDFDHAAPSPPSGPPQASASAAKLDPSVQWAADLLLGHADTPSPTASVDWDLGMSVSDVAPLLLGLDSTATATPAATSTTLVAYRLNPELQQQHSLLRDYHQVLGYLYLLARTQLVALAASAAGPSTPAPTASHPTAPSTPPASAKTPASAFDNQASAGGQGAKLGHGILDASSAVQSHDGGRGAEVSELLYYSRLVPERVQSESRFEANPMEGQATQLQVLAAARAAGHLVAGQALDPVAGSQAVVDPSSTPLESGGREQMDGLAPGSMAGSGPTSAFAAPAGASAAARIQGAGVAPSLSAGNTPYKDKRPMVRHGRAHSAWADISLAAPPEAWNDSIRNLAHLQNLADANPVAIAQRSSQPTPVMRHSTSTTALDALNSRPAFSSPSLPPPQAPVLNRPFGVAPRPGLPGAPVGPGHPPAGPGPDLPRPRRKSGLLPVSGADGAGFLQKLDALANRVTSVFDRPSTPDPSSGHQRGSGPGGRRPAHSPAELATEASEGGSTAPASPRRDKPGMQVDPGKLPRHLSWVSEWRLRAALTSPQSADSLLLQLGLLAAGCFTLGGRSRSAGLLLADTALLLLRQRRWSATMALLEACSEAMAKEQWHMLQGVLLSQMMHVQHIVGDPSLPFTCIRYLSLPEGSVSQEDRLQGQRQLLACIESSSARPSWEHGESDGGAPGPAGDPDRSSGGRDSTLEEGKRLRLPGLRAFSVPYPSQGVSNLIGDADQALPLLTLPPSGDAEADTLRLSGLSTILQPPPVGFGQLQQQPAGPSQLQGMPSMSPETSGAGDGPTSAHGAFGNAGVFLANSGLSGVFASGGPSAAFGGGGANGILAGAGGSGAFGSNVGGGSSGGGAPGRNAAAAAAAAASASSPAAQSICIGQQTRLHIDVRVNLPGPVPATWVTVRLGCLQPCAPIAQPHNTGVHGHASAMHHVPSNVSLPGFSSRPLDKLVIRDAMLQQVLAKNQYSRHKSLGSAAAGGGTHTPPHGSSSYFRTASGAGAVVPGPASRATAVARMTAASITTAGQSSPRSRPGHAVSRSDFFSPDLGMDIQGGLIRVGSASSQATGQGISRAVSNVRGANGPSMGAAGPGAGLTGRQSHSGVGAAVPHPAAGLHGGFSGGGGLVQLPDPQQAHGPILHTAPGAGGGGGGGAHSRTPRSMDDLAAHGPGAQEGAGSGQQGPWGGLEGVEGSGAATAGWVTGPDLVCDALLQVSSLSHAPEPLHPGVSADLGVLLEDSPMMMNHMQQQHAAGVGAALMQATGVGMGASYVLQPGVNRLTLSVSPTHPGLYYLKQLIVCIGGCEVVCSLYDLESGTTPGAPGRRLGKPGRGEGAMEEPGTEQCYEREASLSGVAPPILLAVQPASPQLALVPVAAGGSLVAGAPYQWLGVCLAPQPGSAAPFHHIRIHVSTPEQQGVRVREHPPPPAPVDPALAEGGSGAGAALGASGGPGADTDPLMMTGRLTLGNFGLFSDGGMQQGSMLSRAMDSGGLLGGAGGETGLDSGGAPTCRAQLLMLLMPGGPESDATQAAVNNCSTAATSAAGAGVLTTRLSRSITMVSGNRRTMMAAAAAAAAASGVAVGLSRTRSMRGSSGVAEAEVEVRPGGPAVSCSMMRGALHVSRALRGQPLPAHRAVLAWLPVYCPQQHASTTQDVIVQSYHRHSMTGQGSARHTDLGQALGLAGGWPSAAGNAQHQVVDVSVEFCGADGCWRVHESRLQLTIRPAFTITAQAMHTPLGSDPSAILLVLHVRYDGEQPALLQELDLSLQGGYEVVQALWEGAVQLPRILQPGSAITLAWRLTETHDHGPGSPGSQGDLSDGPDYLATHETASGFLGSPRSPSGRAGGLFGMTGNDMVSGENVLSPTGRFGRAAILAQEQCQLLLVYCTLAAAPRLHASAVMAVSRPGDEAAGGTGASGAAGLPGFAGAAWAAGGDVEGWAPAVRFPEAPVLAQVSSATRPGTFGSAGGAPVDSGALEPGGGRAAVLAAAAATWPTSLYKWGFCLCDMADGEDAADALADISARVQLLRPVSECRLGQPTVFLWRVMRVASRPSGFGTAGGGGNTLSVTRRPASRTGIPGESMFVPSPGGETYFSTPVGGATATGGVGHVPGAAASEYLSYRVLTRPGEGHGTVGQQMGLDEGWRLLSKGQGQVRLGLHPGATATVEVVVLPVTLGHVPAPRLTLTKGLRRAGQEEVTLLLVMP